MRDESGFKIDAACGFALTAACCPLPAFYLASDTSATDSIFVSRVISL
jgi:hypothetical protein